MDAHKTGPKGLKRPRLTPLDRLQIEAGLQNGESPYSIARRIGHDLKTVIREIRDRARTIKTGVACRLSNKCVHRADCKKKHVCPKCLHRRERLCRFCNQCNSHCADYKEDVAEKVFGIRKVSPNDVVLKPSLLGIEVKSRNGSSGRTVESDGSSQRNNRIGGCHDIVRSRS